MSDELTDYVDPGIEFSVEPDAWNDGRWMVAGGTRGGNSRMAISRCTIDDLAKLRELIDQALAKDPAERE